MAGFRKAKAEQAALKLGMYGPPGSGKTMTSLMLGEGLGKVCGKRVALIDTEHGSDFYCQAVASRAVHPEAFDFDALYTKSITEMLAAIKGLKPDEHGVVIVDSMTHVWESCKAAYSGRTTSIGTIPMQAWGKIKKPYKELMALLLSSPMHVIICGRQAVEYETDEETEELKAIGVKFRGEGETAYEPHILLRMESIKPKKTNEVATIIAYAEKDRTGVLSGRSFMNPTFDTICRPLLPLLGDKQAHVATEGETGNIDAEELTKQDAEREQVSAQTLKDYSARLTLAKSKDELKAIGKEITPKLKASMLPADVASLREKYQERETEIGRAPATEATPPTFAFIADAIEKANDKDIVDLAESLLHPGLPEAQQKDLRELAKARRETFLEDVPQ